MSGFFSVTFLSVIIYDTTSKRVYLSDKIRIMNDLLKDLSYQGQKRILIKIADKEHFEMFRQCLDDDVQIDTEIDLRFPYEFMIVFTKTASDERKLAPGLIHNLMRDGVIWFIYEKTDNPEVVSPSKHNWQALLHAGFSKKKIIKIDETHEAMRFDISD